MAAILLEKFFLIFYLMIFHFTLTPFDLETSLIFQYGNT
jgi:hypothetical protein